MNLWSDVAQLWLAALAVTALHSLWIGTLAAGVYAAAVRLGLWRRPQTRYRAGMTLLGAVALALLWICGQELGQTVPVSEATATVLPDHGAQAVMATATPPAVGSGMLAWVTTDGLVWLGGLWLLGAGVSMSRTLRAWLGLRRVVQLAQPLPGLQQRVDQLRAGLGLRGAVRVVCSALDHAPFVIGLLRPVIVLPTSALSGLTPQQVDAILMHELAHVRRVDLWLNLAQVALETGLFFHPAVLWLSRRMREVREECCDDLVLQGGVAAPVYARALLLLEQRRVLSARLAPAAVGGVLLTRIERLVQQREESDAAPAAAPWLALGLFAVVLALGLRWPGLDPLDALDTPRRVLRADSLVMAAAPLPLEGAIAVALPRVTLPGSAADAGSETDVDLTRPAGPSADPGTRVPTRGARTIPLATLMAMPAPVSGTVQPGVTLPPLPLEAQSSPPQPAMPRVRDGAFTPEHSVTPEFPADARDAGSAGRVVLTYTLDSRGYARSVRVEFASGDVAFVSAARAALRQWRYSREDALRLGGDRLAQAFTFRLNDSEADLGDGRCDPELGTRVCRR